jgi:glycosyltransferase involved in cell wall biosynthesis
MDPMRAVIVTSASLGRLPDYLRIPDWLRIGVVGKYAAVHDRWQRFREARWNIISQETLLHKLAAIGFYSNGRIVLEQWNPLSVYDTLVAADIGIIPIDSNESDSADAAWRVKSENRLTMMMAIGLPVIAYPIPSYEALIVTGRNGFLAKSKREWSEYLRILRDPVSRKTIGDAARHSVIDAYSKHEQARKFIEVILRVLGRSFVNQHAEEEGGPQL